MVTIHRERERERYCLLAFTLLLLGVTKLGPLVTLHHLNHGGRVREIRTPTSLLNCV
jgi:hypothetical protein